MKLRYSRLALNDLVSLFEFIAEEDAQAAETVARAIRSAIDRLTRFPSYGHAGDVQDTRQFVIAGMPYIVVYEVEDNTITILRIYHTSQNRPVSS